MSNAPAITRIGPEHQGTRMSLDEFAEARTRPGYHYELEEGVVIVVDVPGLPHGRIIDRVRDQLAQYRKLHPGRIDYVGGGSEAALRFPGLQSERHPDLSIYLNPPPTGDEQPWAFWTPEIVMEVVSAGSANRDYTVKREEYLRAGVRLYWIIDPDAHSVLALLRRGDTWYEQHIPVTGALATPLLPGFELPLQQLFSPGR